MLSVGIEQDQCVGIEFGRFEEQGLERTTVPSIHSVANHGRTACLGDSSAGVGGAIVNADDFIDVAERAGHHRPDGLLLVVHRHSRNDARGRRWSRFLLLRHAFPFTVSYISVIDKKTYTCGIGRKTDLGR